MPRWSWQPRRSQSASDGTGGNGGRAPPLGSAGAAPDEPPAPIQPCGTFTMCAHTNESGRPSWSMSCGSRLNEPPWIAHLVEPSPLVAKQLSSAESVVLVGSFGPVPSQPTNRAMGMANGKSRSLRRMGCLLGGLGIVGGTVPYDAGTSREALRENARYVGSVVAADDTDHRAHDISY